MSQVPGLIVQMYNKKFLPQWGRYGSEFNRIFNIGREESVIGGDGINVKCYIAPPDTARMSNDVHGDVGIGDYITAQEIKIRFNERTPSSNDFTRFSIPVTTTQYQYDNVGTGTIVDMVKEMTAQVVNNFDEHLAVGRHIPRSGRLAQVSGTPKLNNSTTYAGASGTATNAGGARFKITGGSLALIRVGTRLSFYQTGTSTLRAGNVVVTDVNPSDESIGVVFNATLSGPTPPITNARLSSGDLATVANTDDIYFAGAYNQGMFGPAAWASKAVASESFIGGVDRTTAPYRFMNFTRIEATSSGTTKIMASHFDDVGDAMSQSAIGEDDNSGVVAAMHHKLATVLRRDVGEAAFAITPDDERVKQRFANFGMSGANYQHPRFGVIKLIADPLMNPNEVYFLNSRTWMTYFWRHRGIYLPLGSNEGWYRIPSATAGAALSLVLQCDFLAMAQDFCTAPAKNAVLANVAAA